MRQQLCVLRQGTFGQECAILTDKRKLSMLRIIKKNGIDYDKIANEMQIWRLLNQPKHASCSRRTVRNELGIYNINGVYDKAQRIDQGKHLYFPYSDNSIFETPDYIIFKMPYCKFSLQYLLFETEYRFSDTWVAVIMTQCFDAIAYLHSVNIAYCGISPESILIDGALNVVLHDFGLARIISNNNNSHSINNFHRDIETVNKMLKQKNLSYLALDILLKLPVNNKFRLKENDIYGLGLIALLLTVKNGHEYWSPSQTAKHYGAIEKICTMHERFDDRKRDGDCTDSDASNINLNKEYETTMQLLDDILQDVGYVSQDYITLFKRAIHCDPTLRIDIAEIQDQLRSYLKRLSYFKNPRKYPSTVGNSRIISCNAKRLWFQITPRQASSQVGHSVRQLIDTYSNMEPETCEHAGKFDIQLLNGWYNQNKREANRKSISQALKMFGNTRQDRRVMSNVICDTNSCSNAKIFVLKYFNNDTIKEEDKHHNQLGFTPKRWRDFLLSELSTEERFEFFTDGELIDFFCSRVKKECLINMVALRDEFVCSLNEQYRL